MAEWLRAQGFEAHVEAFVREGISIAMIPGLSDAELRELGVERIGDRHRLRALAGASAVPTAARSSTPATSPAVAQALPTTTVAAFPTSTLPIVGMAGVAGTLLGLAAKQLDDGPGSVFIGFSLLFAMAWGIDHALRKPVDGEAVLERAHRVDAGSFAAQMACLLGVCLGLSARDDDMWSFFVGALPVVATVAGVSSALTAELFRPRPRPMLHRAALVLVALFGLLVVASVDGLARVIRWRGDYGDLDEERLEVVVGAAMILVPWGTFLARSSHAAALADADADTRTEATVHAFTGLWLARCLFAVVMTLWWLRACVDDADNVALVGMVAAGWLPVRLLANVLAERSSSGATTGTETRRATLPPDAWRARIKRLRDVPAEALVDIGRRYDRSVLPLATFTFWLVWVTLRWLGDAHDFQHMERAGYARTTFVGIALFLLVVRAKRNEAARPLTAVIGAHAAAAVLGIPLLSDAWVMSAALSYAATRAVRAGADPEALDAQREAVAPRVLLAVYMAAMLVSNATDVRSVGVGTLTMGLAGSAAFVILTLVDAVALRVIRVPVVVAALVLGVLHAVAAPWLERLPIDPFLGFALGWTLTARAAPTTRPLWRGVLSLATLSLGVSAALPVGTVTVSEVAVSDTLGNTQLGGTITVDGKPLDPGVLDGGEAPAGVRRWTVSHPLADVDATTWEFPTEYNAVRLTVNLTRGRLRVRPSRDGAPILLDGVPMDTTSSMIVTAGEHVVSVAASEDWARESRTVSVEAGKTVTVEMPVTRLRLDPTIGSSSSHIGDETF